MIRRKDFHMGTSSTGTEFLIETWTEEIKSVVTEEIEFNYRDESHLMEFLEILDYQHSDSRNKINVF